MRSDYVEAMWSDVAARTSRTTIVIGTGEIPQCAGVCANWHLPDVGIELEEYGESGPAQWVSTGGRARFACGSHLSAPGAPAGTDGRPSGHSVMR